MHDPYFRGGQDHHDSEPEQDGRVVGMAFVGLIVVAFLAFVGWFVANWDAIASAVVR